MKKLNKTLLIISLAIVAILSSCKKDDDDSSNPNNQILGTWRVMEEYIKDDDGKWEKQDLNHTVETYQFLDDNRVIWKDIYIDDDGNSSESDGGVATYVLNDDNLIMEYAEYQIETLSNTTLTLIDNDFLDTSLKMVMQKQ